METLIVLLIINIKVMILCYSLYFMFVDCLINIINPQDLTSQLTAVKKVCVII